MPSYSYIYAIKYDNIMPSIFIRGSIALNLFVEAFSIIAGNIYFSILQVSILLLLFACFLCLCVTLNLETALHNSLLLKPTADI